MKAKVIYFLVAAVAVPILTGCSTLLEKPSEDLPVTMRASFVYDCPYGQQSDAELESVGALLGADLIGKAVTGLISFANDQLQNAAKADAEAFTLSSASPEYLVGTNAETKKQRVQCLIVAAGPTKTGGNICEDLPDSNPLFGGSKPSWCGPAAAAASLWPKWGFQDISFLAQIEFSKVKGGSPTYRIPMVKRIYYPRSLSGRATDKIKGLALEISATDSTDPKNPQVFSVRLDGSGIVPGVEGTKVIALSDKWIVVTPQPKEQLSKDQLKTRPINLSVTLTETPRPNWLLQKAAKLAADKEDDIAKKLSEAAVQAWIPEQRAKAAGDQATAERNAKLKLAGLCDTWFSKGQALETAKAAKPIENPISPAAAALDRSKRANAVQVATLNLAQAQADASAAWDEAEYTAELCTGPY